MSDFCAVARQYVDDVLGGNTAACKWTRLACERQKKELARQGDSDWLYLFDESRANRICRFVELLPHVKGDLAGKPIMLEPWQVFILGTAFGWVKKENGKRRFRKIYIEVPRGNAKSTLSSGVGLYMAFADGQGGADVYSAATTREQARIVFRDAQLMVRRSPDFREAFGVEVLSHSIVQESTGSKFMALSADDNTLDGLNIHLAIVDELHAHKTRGVHDVLETGIGKRLESMLWEITTAGFNRSGICYEIRDYVRKILEGVLDDDQYFGTIFSIDDGDDWTTRESLQKANPNWGISVEIDSVIATQRKAMRMPSSTNNFLTKHLNVWVNADVGLFDMMAWDNCSNPKLKPEDFKGCHCWMGIDLGFVDDIAATVKLFIREEKLYFFGRYYLPEDTIEESRNSQYSGWKRANRITATSGNVTDIEVILDDLESDLSTYDVRSVAFDPYNKLLLLNTMQKRGVSAEKLVEFPQTVAMMSPATETLMKAIRSKHVGHNGCPVMSWSLSNVVGHFDAKDNVYPKKERPENKIDPAIAGIMAVGISRLQSEGPSVYESRGLLTA